MNKFLAGVAIACLLSPQLWAEDIIVTNGSATWNGGTVTAAALFPAGTASLPSVAVGENTSGMYWSNGTGSTHITALATNGVSGLAQLNPGGTLRYVLGSGITTQATMGGSSAQEVQIPSTGATVGQLANVANTQGSDTYCGHSRNATWNSFTALQSGDYICRTRLFGDDGSTYNTIAVEEDFNVDTTVSTGVIPGRWHLNIMSSGGTLQNDLCADSSGAFWVATTSTSTGACSTGKEIFDHTGALYTTPAVVIGTATKFTVASCSPSSTVGTSTAGKFVAGATGTCNFVVTLGGATGITAANGWSCAVSDSTTANLMRESAYTTTTATLTGTVVTNDVIIFNCTAF